MMGKTTGKCLLSKKNLHTQISKDVWCEVLAPRLRMCERIALTIADPSERAPTHDLCTLSFNRTRPCFQGLQQQQQQQQQQQHHMITIPHFDPLYAPSVRHLHAFLNKSICEAVILQISVPFQMTCEDLRATQQICAKNNIKHLDLRNAQGVCELTCTKNCDCKTFVRKHSMAHLFKQKHPLPKITTRSWGNILQSVCLRGCTALQSLGGLEGVRVLDISHCPDIDFDCDETRAVLAHVVALDVSHNHNLEFLDRWISPTTTFLNLEATNIASIEPLAGTMRKVVRLNKTNIPRTHACLTLQPYVTCVEPFWGMKGGDDDGDNAMLWTFSGLIAAVKSLPPSPSLK